MFSLKLDSLEDVLLKLISLSKPLRKTRFYDTPHSQLLQIVHTSFTLTSSNLLNIGVKISAHKTIGNINEIM